MRLTQTKEKGKKVANQQLVKETNIALLFDLIYKYGPVSRAELAQRTRLSPTTVSSLVEELLRNEVIMETGAGATTTSGRKPIMLETNPDGGYVVSVEMLEDGFLCFLYNIKCEQVSGEKFAVDDYALIGKRITQEIDGMLKANGIPDGKLFGICTGVPGLIDYESNRVTTSTVIPIDEGNNFYSDIKSRYGEIPVFIENESSLCAYAEKEFGIPENVDNLVFIEINTGIGAGIILDGRIFRGSFGLAGEIGHISIDINGPKCKCGNRGCLEIMASVPAIIQKVIFSVMSGSDTVINSITGNDFNKINMDVIKYAVGKNDPMIMEIIDDAAVKLASGINNVINLFNPQVVAVGGEITKLGDGFLDSLTNKLNAIQLKPNIRKVKIKYSGLRENAATLGGARYTLDNIFETSKGFYKINGA